MRQILKVSLVLLLAICTLKLANLSAAKNLIASGTIAKNFSLERVGGERVSLSDFKGQVVLLNFWATWCPHCRKAIPALEHLQEQFKGKKFSVIGINTDKSRSQALRYVRDSKVRFPIVFDTDNSVMADYDVRGIPAFFLLDKNGIIRKKYDGFAPGLEKEWEKEIILLLGKTK